MLTFVYTGAAGKMTVPEAITTGMRGKQVVLEFSPEWEGLAKTVVFSNGEKTRDVVFGGNPVTIPAEILEEPLKKLTVGVYGVGDRGELAIPTVRALGPVILPGALPSGEAAAEPVIPLWEQIHAQLGDLSQLDTETKESLVAAINEMMEKYRKLMNPDKTLTLEGVAADAKAVGDALTGVEQELERYFNDFKGVFLVTASDEEADRSAGEILAAAEMGMMPVLYVVHADGAFFAPLFRFREETALFEVPGIEDGTATLMTFAVDEEKRVTVTIDYQTNSGADQGSAGVIGAVGDGVADDTLAFRAALAGNRVVYVPGGTYKLSGELVIGDNCCLELSQDTVLEFAQTSGNCITLGMLSTLKGNHATVKVPYAFDGHVLHAYSNDHTNAEAQAVPPWSKWDPQWKSGRYVSDLNICKADSRGFHYAVTPGDCKGTAVYISADNTAGMLTFMWGIHYSGLRIAGAFAYGIHAQNFDSGWVHEMRIDAFIDACETGVCLEDCSNTYISATIQPRRAYTEDQRYVPYAKHGIKLVRSKNTDLSGSRVWDWSAAYTLWTQDNEHQHIAMYGDCSGTILNDFGYHSQGDTRKRIYTDNDHNLETLSILQEPVDRWFKVIGGEPYYTDGLTNQRLLRKDALDAFVDVDFVKNFSDVLATATDADGVTVFNDIGYQIGKRFTSLGTGTDLADSTYYMTTGFIRVPLGSTIYGRGLHFDDTAKSYAGIVYYNANRERVASMTIANVVQGNQYYVLNYKRTSDGFSVQIPSSVTLSNLNATYVRLVFPMTCVGEFPMLSIDEEIRYTVEGFLADGVKVKGKNVIGNVDTEVPGSSQNANGTAIDFDKNVKAINHRGYCTVAPENTIPAYILSKKMGFTYVEADVSFTSDGVAVLLHDNSIDRTSNGSGNLSAMTYEDVLQYDFGSWKSAQYAGTKIASFDEFIALCRGIGLHPYIELKNNGAYTESQIRGLVDIVKSYSMAKNVTWISFTHTYLGYVKNADPSARLGLLCWSDWTFDRYGGNAQALKTDTNEVFLDVNYAWPAESYVLSKDAGIPVEVWTVNTEDEIKALNPYVSGVTSDTLIAGKVLYEQYMEYGQPTVPNTYAVTNNLTNATNSNGVAKVAKNAAYNASIIATEGYLLSAVTVVMGGVDVTANVYSNGAISIPAVTGNIVITAEAVKSGSVTLKYTITNSLTNVSSNNSSASVAENASYTATLTAVDGYNLNKVTVTMGGTDVTATVYANGVVNISAVTDNVVITATAVKEQAEPVLLHNWDLTTSMTDTVGGVVATTNGTQDSNGLKIEAANQYCDFGEVYGPDRTFELDVVSSAQTAGNEHGYGRLLMVDTDALTGTGGSGIIHTCSAGSHGWKWYAYNAGGWRGVINEALDGTAADNYGRGCFDGKTVQLYISSERIATLYVDGVEMGTCDRAFIEYTGGHIYMGSSQTDILYTTIVSGFRVYSGLHI